MATTTSNKRAIPGLPKIDRRIVTKTNARTNAVLSQAQADVEAFRQLSLQMKQLRDELEAIRGRLLHTMQTSNQRALYTADRTFIVSLRERASWTYSDELEDRLTMLKAEQQNEQRKGIAINKPTTYIDGRTVTA